MSLIKLQGNASGTGAFTIAAPNGNTDRTLTLPDATGTVLAAPAGAVTINSSAPSNSLTVDASGNLGIGTSSPSADLSVGSTTTSSGDVHLRTSKTAVELTPSNSDAGGMDINVGWVAGGQGPMKFSLGSTERARITAGGFLLSGTTSDLGGQFNSLGTGRDAIVAQVTSNSNSPYLGKNSAGSVIFIVSGLGTIFAVNTTVQSTSDVRTKENIRDSTDGLQVVMGLRPRRFDFKAGFGGDRKDVLGFVAQEIEQVFPDAVDLMPSGSTPDDPEEPYKSVGPGALIPVLVKAVQEQQAQIEELKAEVAALKGASA